MLDISGPSECDANPVVMNVRTSPGNDCRDIAMVSLSTDNNNQ